MVLKTFNTFREWNQIDQVWNSLVKTFEHDFIYRILRIRIPPTCTNLALLCCLNLKISWIEESVTSILIQSTMANIYMCFALKLIRLLTVSNLCPLEIAQRWPSLCITKKDDYSSFWQKGFWWDFSSSYIREKVPHFTNWVMRCHFVIPLQPKTIYKIWIHALQKSRNFLNLSIASVPYVWKRKSYRKTFSSSLFWFVTIMQQLNVRIDYEINPLHFNHIIGRAIYFHVV